jgi:hypothetical protein
LAVLALKADDDSHLPLQALDHWAPCSGITGGASSRFGYFGGRELQAKNHCFFW